MMINRGSLLVAACLAVVASACSDEKKPAVAPAASAAPAASDTSSSGDKNPKPDDDATKGNLNISDEIRKACGLTDSEAYFAFDSAHVRPQDQKVLKKLADCFSTGPLKGREMRLVGHRRSAWLCRLQPGARGQACRQRKVGHSDPRHGRKEDRHDFPGSNGRNRYG